MTQLFERKGRRYVPWGHAELCTHDVMKAGTWRLSYAYTDGGTRYAYEVRPDTASFGAACQLAQVAMEAAIRDAAIATPQLGTTPYTKRQRELIEQFRSDMAAAGGFVPAYWDHASAWQIAQAGIDAVRNWKG